MKSVTEGDEKPNSNLRVVAENDEATVARERHRWLYEQPLRHLAANLMRVTRGAGASHDIISDCSAFLEGCQEYRNAAGVWPTGPDLQSALSIEPSDNLSLSDAAAEWEYGMRTMMRGSLRIAAGDLLRQTLQSKAGERDVLEGFKVIEQIRAANRAKHLAATRPAAAKSRTSKKPGTRPERKS
jgi:hypothetical protein